MLQLLPTRIARKPNHSVRPSPPALQQFCDHIHLIEATPVGSGIFSAATNGKLAVLSSRLPFFDAARQLLHEGADSNSWAICRHAGSTVESFRSKLCVLAGLTVEDDRLGQPKFRRWRGSRGDGAAPPIAPREVPALLEAAE
jgi:hypothetical protein